MVLRGHSWSLKSRVVTLCEHEWLEWYGKEAKSTVDPQHRRVPYLQILSHLVESVDAESVDTGVGRLYYAIVLKTLEHLWILISVGAERVRVLEPMFH